jgi:hypothetical protein
MARVALTVQEIARTGIVPAYVAGNATDDHEFVNDGKTFLHVKNGGVAPIDVILQTPGTVDGLAVADRTVSVANASEKMIGPFPTTTYNQAGGKVYVDLTVDTSVTLAAFKI